MRDDGNPEALESALRNTLALSDDAVAWLMDVFRSIQTLDDYADGDPVERAQLDKLIWSLLAGCWMNPFFQRFQGQLLPVMACAILQWQAADKVEREGRADARSFVWRAGFYQLALMAVLCQHGPEVAMKNGDLALGIYGEKFEHYMKEF